MIRSNRGMALILTMWVLLALVFLALSMGLMARTEIHISRNYADVTNCRWAARAGVYRALSEVETLAGSEGTYLNEETYILTSEESDLDLGGYSFEVQIQDEAGRVNVNTASAETLTLIFGDSEISGCILDWRDTDDTPMPEGAESEYYSTLDSPYQCRNAEFETPGELNLVKGLTEDVLLAPVSEDGPAAQDLITVYTGSIEGQSDNSSKVDIQTADRQSIQNALGTVLTEQEIDAIISYRTRSAFRTAADIVRVPGLSRSKIIEIYDRLTVSDSRAQTGLLNVNTASVQAIAVQPGMDQGIAESIIEYRTGHGAFSSIGSLLELNEVTNDAFAGAAPRLAVRSSIFRIVSTGYLASSGARATIIAIVDSADGQVQTRYWQE